MAVIPRRTGEQHIIQNRTQLRFRTTRVISRSLTRLAITCEIRTRSVINAFNGSTTQTVEIAERDRGIGPFLLSKERCMQIAIPFSYTAEEIPPKCRKPHKVQKDASLTVSIAEITGAQAPVAFLEHGSDFGESFTREYRWYSGCLWLLEKVNAGNDDSEIQTAEQFLKNPECLHSVAQHYDSRQDNENAIFEQASEIVFIDGVRWRRTLEPEYFILASINWTSLDVVYGAKH